MGDWSYVAFLSNMICLTYIVPEKFSYKGELVRILSNPKQGIFIETISCTTLKIWVNVTNTMGIKMEYDILSIFICFLIYWMKEKTVLGHEIAFLTPLTLQCVDF